MINKKVNLSVIVPFYNEEHEIEGLFHDIENFEIKHPNLIKEYIFINGCSNDSSFSKISQLFDVTNKNLQRKMIIHSNEKNIGWCKSLIKGYEMAVGESILFIPGDGEAKLTEFLNPSIDLEKEIITFQRASMVGRPKLRILISYIYRLIIGIIFFIKPMDFNGLIILKKSKIKNLKLSSDSFFISAEIIIKSIKLNFSRDFKNSFKLSSKNNYKSSSISFFQLFKILKDICKIYLFLFKRFY